MTSCVSAVYRVYSPRDSSLTPLPQSLVETSEIRPALPPLPPDWEVLSSVVADVTGDGKDDLILLVRRPWRDWEIMRWHGGKSPIAAFHDSDAMSSHIIVLSPDGRTIWAGSALPRPMIGLAAGDIDGDGRVEIVTLEGDYADRPHGQAHRIDVWRWDTFGFVLVHRSPPGVYRRLLLRDIDDDGIVDIIVR